MAVFAWHATVPGVHGANWPQWRGPTFDGTSAETGLPDRLSATNGVRWVAELPGKSGATPIVWNDRVFATAAAPDSQALRALCLDANDGRLLWHHDAGTGFTPLRGNTAASPSPVTDGTHVFFMFGNGRLLACDVDGTLRWQRDICADHGPFRVKWGYASSPLLYGGKLYVPVIHGFGQVPPPPSYLLCIDPATGRDLWRRERPTDAPEESLDAYTTPYPFITPGGVQIVLNGGDCVTGHDPATGDELWRSDNYNTKNSRVFRTIVSCTGGNGILLCPVPKSPELFALRAGGRGQLTRENRVWTLDTYAPDCCVPLLYRGRLFVLDGMHRVMTCLDPATGAQLGQRKMPGTVFYYASPTGADSKIFCINIKGQTVVLRADESMNELSRDTMGEGMFGASVVPANGRLYIRTDSKLFCIGR